MTQCIYCFFFSLLRVHLSYRGAGRLEGNIPLQGGVHFRGDVSSLDHCFSEIESVLPCIVEMFSLILKIFSSVFFLNAISSFFPYFSFLVEHYYWLPASSSWAHMWGRYWRLKEFVHPTDICIV